MEALVRGGAECAPDGGQNQLSKFVSHLDSDASRFREGFASGSGSGSGDMLMQHAMMRQQQRPAEFDDRQFVEEFQSFNGRPQMGMAGPDAFQQFHPIKSELEGMLERNGPGALHLASAPGSQWAGEFEQFQQSLPPGSSDLEFEAAYMSAMRNQGGAQDWGSEFAQQHRIDPHLDSEFERLESAFSKASFGGGAQITELDAAWTEEFSRIQASLDKGKGKETEISADDAEMTRLQEVFEKWQTNLNYKDGEPVPAEMLEDFNQAWKKAAGDDVGNLSSALGGLSWGDEFEDFQPGKVVDPDPVTADLAPYSFETENPYLSHSNPFEEGMRLMNGGGTLNAAALAFEAAVQRDVENSEAWMMLGKVQAENEKEIPGIAALQRSVQLDPTNLPALLSLAISYTNEGQELQAYATLERWIHTKYPAVLQAHPPPASGTVSSPSEVHERATRLFIEAVKLGPSAAAKGVSPGADIDADVQEGLGVLFYLRSEYDKAIDCFGTALGVVPTNYLLWNRLGATLANSGKTEEAIDAYYKALEIKPSFVRVRYNLGVGCLNIGCYKEAAEHLLSALTLHESDGKRSAMGITNSSDNIWDMLRRALINLDRRDLADVTITDRDLNKFRPEFDF